MGGRNPSFSGTYSLTHRYKKVSLHCKVAILLLVELILSQEEEEEKFDYMTCRNPSFSGTYSLTN